MGARRINLYLFPQKDQNLPISTGTQIQIYL